MNSGSRKLLAPVFKMASATMTSRVFGLIREQVMAHQFGASGLTDAFMVAFRLPNMLRDLFAEGSLNSAFVPIFTDLKIKDPERAKKLLWSLGLLLFLITGIISIALAYFAPEVVKFVTDPKFVADTQRYEITVYLTMIMAPFLTVVSLAALCMGALNAYKVFFLPAIAPALFNVVMIISMLTLPPLCVSKGFHPIFSLGIGVIGGGIVQWICQLPKIFSLGLLPKGGWELWSPEIKKVFGRLGIGTIGVGANQVNILITTILATGTQLGAVSWLSYAFRLFQFPVGIIGVSVANSNLVLFSEAWKGGDREKSVEVLRGATMMGVAAILPATALLFSLGDLITEIVFLRGEFDAEDAAMTSLALSMYGIGLPFYALYKVWGPAFFTLDKPSYPVLISIGSIICNIIFCLTYTPVYGFKILALGTSFSMILNCSLQCLFLNKILKVGFAFFPFLGTLKCLVASAGCYFISHWAHDYFLNTDWNLAQKIMGMGMMALTGVVIYLVLMMAMGEKKNIFSLLKR